MKYKASLIALLVFILIPNVMFAGIYKCVDGDGNISFTASPKPGCTLLGGSAEPESLQGFAEMERLALLIGNSHYNHGGSLANPVNDVRAIKKALESLGFTVMKYENCSQETMKRAMDKFGWKLKGKNVGLFFYAGHGVQVNGHNYLLPADAKLDSVNDAEYDCVRADRVLAKMESAGSRTNIVILDACRNNPFERSWRRGTEGSGLAFMNAPSGSLIAYSTAPGKTALDGRGKNSPYTAALLQHLGTPNITVIQMFQRVRSTVKGGSGGQQTPWESTSLMGNFYFASKGEERDRLEQERRELQRMRTEIENNKRESQEKRVGVASVPSKPSYSRPSSTSKETEWDGIYVAYANGIIKDINTGLEWKVGPDRDTNWNEARSWVQSLTLDGGGWRMPSLRELAVLYKKEAGFRNMTPLLKTTGWWIWSGEPDDSTKAGAFNFYSNRHGWGPRSYSSTGRAFAVRSRKESQEKRVEVASVPEKPSDSTSPSSDIIGRDGQYVAYRNGIVKNTNTGLEWVAGPDKKTSWYKANRWVKSLTLDGGGWRLPTLSEAGSLFERTENQSKMSTTLFNTRVYAVWSNKTDGSTYAWWNSIYPGQTRKRINHSYDGARAFAVRQSNR